MYSPLDNRDGAAGRPAVPDGRLLQVPYGPLELHWHPFDTAGAGQKAQPSDEGVLMIGLAVIVWIVCGAVFVATTKEEKI